MFYCNKKEKKRRKQESRRNSSLAFVGFLLNAAVFTSMTLSGDEGKFIIVKYAFIPSKQTRQQKEISSICHAKRKGEKVVKKI